MTEISGDRISQGLSPDSVTDNRQRFDLLNVNPTAAQDSASLDEETLAYQRPSTDSIEFVNRLEEVKRFISQDSKGELVLYKHPNGVYLLGRERLELTIGGKASGVIGLADDGYRIPNTLMISKDVFSDSIFDPQGRILNQSLAIEKIKPLLHIVRECLSIAGITELAAIRSSGPEDAKNHTAAGLFHSNFQFLDVSDDKFADQIIRVLHSAFTKNARTFYERQGLKPEPISLMIQNFSGRNLGQNVEFFKVHWGPDFAGVIDTSNPNFVQINVVVGLGTTAVQGVRSMNFLVDRETFKVSLSGGQYLEEYIVRDKKGNAALQGTVREWKYKYGIGDKERILELAKAALSMEKDGMGIDIEFTLLKRKANSNELVIEYLQRRQIKRYQNDFKLPDSSEMASAIQSDSLVGQGIAQDSQVFFTEVFYQPSILPFSSSQSAMLMEYNMKHREGYVLVIKFPGGNTPEQFMWSWQNTYPFHTYSNAKAIVVIDSNREGYRGMSNESGTGSVLTSHFSQFLRSEGKPMIILPAEKGQKLLSAIEAGSTAITAGRALNVPSFLRSILSIPGWKSFSLNSPLVVGVDQVKQQGIVGLFKKV